QRALDAFELRRLPALEADAGGGERLAHGGDRDTRLAREIVDALHFRSHVLAVEHPDLDLALARLFVDGPLVGSGHFGAVGDRPGEPVGGQQPQPERFAERAEDALAVADRRALVARADLAHQRVVAGETPGQEELLTSLEVGAVARVKARVVGRDRTRDATHALGRVPLVRVGAVVQP